jgi:uncharacterized protein (TIGR02145 family)
MPIRARLAVIALTAALSGVGVIASTLQNTSTTDARPASKRMPDGKLWTTSNLNVDVQPSYCYDDVKANCDRYGRLYTWESAKRACQSLGDGWRLPTNDDWRQTAKPFGGVRDDSDDGGKAAFTALMTGGRSGFEAVFGGGRRVDGEYARLDAHGLYWTASASDPGHAWFYNLGRGGQILNRHADGERQRAFAVRCIRE